MSEAETQGSKMASETAPGSSQSWSDSETDAADPKGEVEKKQEPYVLGHTTLFLCV